MFINDLVGVVKLFVAFVLLYINIISYKYSDTKVQFSKLE